MDLIIFDCDGVLVDSEYLASKFFCNLLHNYGYSISVEESIKRFAGVHENSCREMIMKEAKVQIPEDYWAKEQANLLKTFELTLTSLLNPFLEMLDKLKIAKCVASNSSHKYVMKCLEITQGNNYFHKNAIFSAEQVSKAKPAPDLFLFAAKNMGVQPENCIVIEDSLSGAQAAIAAGMKVKMFLGGSHARFDWYRERISMLDLPIFSSYKELLESI